MFPYGLPPIPPTPTPSPLLYYLPFPDILISHSINSHLDRTFVVCCYLRNIVEPIVDSEPSYLFWEETFPFEPDIILPAPI